MCTGEVYVLGLYYFVKSSKLAPGDRNKYSLHFTDEETTAHRG